jgi:hypothetical protein
MITLESSKMSSDTYNKTVVWLEMVGSRHDER